MRATTRHTWRRGRRRTMLACAIGAALALVLPGQDSGRLEAATIVVTRFDDPAPDGCLPGDCSLREAVIAANAAPGADVIALAAGTYQLGIAGPYENAAATGDLDLTSALTLAGADAATTIIDGGDLDRVLHVTAGSRAIVSGVTLRNGDNANLLDPSGGIVFNEGTLEVRDSIVRDGVSGLGGGIYNTGSLLIVGSEIRNNVQDEVGTAVA